MSLVNFKDIPQFLLLRVEGTTQKQALTDVAKIFQTIFKNILHMW